MVLFFQIVWTMSIPHSNVLFNLVEVLSVLLHVFEEGILYPVTRRM